MQPRLIAITDTGVAPPGTLEARLEALCAAARPGTVLVQLRDLALPTRARVELGRRLRALTRDTAQFLAVNDRADLAVLLEADGLHLGEAAVATSDARRIVGSMWISRALHDPERAADADADALLLSPLLEPRKGRAALGLGALRRCRELFDERGSKASLFALGGVTALTARACLDHGADGVAAIGAALSDAPRPLLTALGVLRS
jgi:thiamine-phosphate diphosphorylase